MLGYSGVAILMLSRYTMFFDFVNWQGALYCGWRLNTPITLNSSVDRIHHLIPINKSGPTYEPLFSWVWPSPLTWTLYKMHRWMCKETQIDKNSGKGMSREKGKLETDKCIQRERERGGALLKLPIRWSTSSTPVIIGQLIMKEAKIVLACNTFPRQFYFCLPSANYWKIAIANELQHLEDTISYQTDSFGMCLVLPRPPCLGSSTRPQSDRNQTGRQLWVMVNRYHSDQYQKNQCQGSILLNNFIYDLQGHPEIPA